MQSLFDWLTHPAVLSGLALGSVLLFVLGILGVPWFVARIPPDYFTRDEQEKLGSSAAAPAPLALFLRGLKNLLGIVLLLLGLAMLVLPGQGVLTIAASLFLIDFPGKRRTLRKFIHIPLIYRTICAIRARANRPPLERPPESSPPKDSTGR